MKILLVALGTVAAFATLSAATASAGCVRKKNRVAMEMVCDMAMKHPAGLYSKTKVSATCGMLGAKWIQIASSGMCGCCVLKKEAPADASNNGGGALGHLGNGGGLLGHAAGIICAKKHWRALYQDTKAATFPNANGVLKKNGYDKYIHCGVSALLRRKCGTAGASAAGFAKEIGDLFDKTKDNSFGSGDLKADLEGIRIGAAASSNADSLSRCNAKYPKKP